MEQLKQFVKVVVKEAMEASKLSNYASRRFQYQNENHDENFVVSFTAHSKTLHVWANNGLITLLSQDGVTTLDEATSLATEVLECFLNGEILCSCCCHKIKKEEVAGCYFAGNYCKTCWENKYQAIEAAETYE